MDEDIMAMDAKSRHEKRTAEIIREFMTNTTAHGWGHAVRSRHIPMRALWVTLTLLALLANIAHVTVLTLQYLEFPYEQVSRVEVDEIAFPSVTICNILPISQTSAQEALNNSSTHFSQWNNTTNYFFSKMANYSGEYIFQQLYDRLRGPRGFFENIGDEVQDIGHKGSDFILNCIFALQPCNWRNFTQFQSATYYNCFTFNGGNLSAAKLVTQMTGPQAGLSLILYLESDNGDALYNAPYYNFLSVGNAAGVRVVIHPPDTYPSPIDHGFDIPPGYSSSVGVGVSKYWRLGLPYSECKENPFTSSDGKHLYSDHECTMACQQRMVMAGCGCISAELPHIKPQTLPYCGWFNESDPGDIFNKTACEYQKQVEFLSSEKLRANCACHAPCFAYEYDTQVSYSYWPIDLSQETFFNLHVANKDNRDSLKAWNNLKSFDVSSLIQRSLIRKNFIRLNIYIQSLVIREYMQQGSYTFYNLFSDIGGTFGLWIGMSLLTWGEVLEFIIKMTVRWFRKLVRGVSGKRVGDEMDSTAGNTSKRNVFLT